MSGSNALNSREEVIMFDRTRVDRDQAPYRMLARLRWASGRSGCIQIIGPLSARCPGLPPSRKSCCRLLISSMFPDHFAALKSTTMVRSENVTSVGAMFVVRSGEFCRPEMSMRCDYTTCGWRDCSSHTWRSWRRCYTSWWYKLRL